MSYGYLLAAGGSLLGSYLSAQGSKNAAQTQSDAQMQAAAIQQQMFNRIVAQEQPFIQTGYNATDALNSLMGFGGNGGTPGYTGGLYGQPIVNAAPNQGSTGANTSVGGMPNRGMGVGYEGPMSSLGGNAFTGASGSPTTMTLGGQQTSGSPGFNWGQALAAGAAGLAGGPLAALMAGKMTGNSNSFTFTDPSTGKVITVPGATDVKPTEITMPTTQMTTPGLIMDPTTGGYIGQAYYSTPVGAAREQTLNRGMSNFLGEQASNEADTYQFRRHHQRAMGGEVHAGNGWNSYVVGEGGKDARPEILHLSPGSTGYVEPNPATISAMMKKKTPTQRSTGSTLPGRMLGGPVGMSYGTPVIKSHNFGGFAADGTGVGLDPALGGIGDPVTLGVSGNLLRKPKPAIPKPAMGGIGATAQNTAQQADWRPTGSGSFGSGVFGPSIGNPSQPVTGPQVGAQGGNSGAYVPSYGTAQPGSLMQTFIPQTFNPTQADLTNYPGYQFQLQQGNLAIQNSAATKYGALSGAGLKDMENYDQGLAASNYGNYFNQFQQQQGNLFNMFQTQQNNIFNRLAQLSSIGQNAAGNLGSQGANLGTGIAQANAAAGGSLAGGQLGAANAYAGAANTIPLYMLLANQGGG